MGKEGQSQEMSAYLLRTSVTGIYGISVTLYSVRRKSSKDQAVSQQNECTVYEATAKGGRQGLGKHGKDSLLKHFPSSISKMWHTGNQTTEWTNAQSTKFSNPAPREFNFLLSQFSKNHEEKKNKTSCLKMWELGAK